jgi:hypothetical protein
MVMAARAVEPTPPGGAGDEDGFLGHDQRAPSFPAAS